jgi:hypothetical protein
MTFRHRFRREQKIAHRHSLRLALRGRAPPLFMVRDRRGGFSHRASQKLEF